MDVQRVHRRDVILDAAAELFRDRGFHAVGVDQIGEQAGVTGPAIYRHFSGKDEILAALFDLAIDRLTLYTNLSAGDPADRLDAMVLACVKLATEDRDLVVIHQREQRSLVDPWRRSVHRRLEEHLERWRSVIKDCFPDISDGALTTAAPAANSLLLAIATWPRDARRNPDLAHHMRVVVRTSLAALAEGGATKGGATKGAGRPGPGSRRPQAS
jgi:AcrR family transcriptional regulator